VAVTGSFLTAAALAAGVEAQVGGVSASINNVSGALEIDATQTLTLAGAAAGPGGSLAFTALRNPPTGSLDDVDAREPDGARRSLLRIDAALDSINAQRSRFGALEGRFEAVANGLQSDAQLTASTRGRIVDADYATETAHLAREQVLQQAALAMVAQANAHASDVLALVR
jgi:flagellin